MTKCCVTCASVRPLDQFNKRSASKDGLDYTCKECKKVKYAKTKEYVSTLKKAYHAKNKVRLQSKMRAYYEKNKYKILLDKKKYHEEKRAERSAYNAIYRKKRRKMDINFKLQCNLRARLNGALKRALQRGHQSAVKNLGCSILELKIYLESKFKPGMTWENWGSKGWHIDHVKPLSSFDLANSEEFAKAIHYTNLQPLWAEDNLKKGSKF